MRSKSGFIGKLFALTVLAAAVWWVWVRGGVAWDQRVLAGRLENALNQELLAFGFTDTQVLRQVRREQKHLGFVWIETQRDLAWPSWKELPLLSSRLHAVAGKQGCWMWRRTTVRQAVYEFRWGPLVLHRLRLFPVRPMGQSGAAPKYRVAIVIDDVALDPRPMDRFTALGIPLTFAVLPGGQMAHTLADKARTARDSVLLHLPMEPVDMVHNNPGSAALYLKMNGAAVRRQLDKNWASVPGAEGINNHMGSAFTSDKVHMDLVMAWVKHQKVFFLDSHTSTGSVVARAARGAGVPCLVNDTFLDNQDDQAAIELQLDQVRHLALRNGQTVAIGHYRRKYLASALASRLPEFRKAGIEFVTVPTLLSSGLP